jgi:hypothetical protein
MKGKCWSLLCAALIVLACSDERNYQTGPEERSLEGAAAPVGSGRPFSTTLTGAEEVPGPGDSDGTGTARIRLNQGQGTVCFELSWQNIADPTAAHIHPAPAGVAGPIVVGFFGPPTGAPVSPTGCVENVSASLIKAIRQDPAAYYVNIHNADFPAGAIRGQLSK